MESRAKITMRNFVRIVSGVMSPPQETDERAGCTNPKGNRTIKRRDMVSGEMKVLEIKRQWCSCLRVGRSDCGQVGNWFETKE